jgi:hypothetical protein
MKHIIHYIFLFLLFAFWGCESYYNPEIEQFPDALVVEGMLTDQNDFAIVKLTRSAAYSDQSYFYGERKATVTIESESGLVYPTTEFSRGVYQTNDPVPTIAGEGYFVRIITTGNVEYRSKIEKMMSYTPIDSIYLTDTILKDISYNYWNEPVVKDYAGITVSVVPKEPSVPEAGFLYKWNAIANYYIFSTSGGTDFHYYCWKMLSSNLIYVYNYVHDDYVNELPMGDLHTLSMYALSPLPIDSSNFEPVISQAYSTSFYYRLRQYAISKDGSKFWRSVKNQSEASGKLFDPVEEQIIGNIDCKTDSTKVAFGFFNVASFSEKVIRVKLTHDKHADVNTVNVMPVPESEEDCYLYVKPEFWY